MMQEIPGAPADDHRASKSVLLNTFVVKKKRCRVYLHRGTLVWETERPPYSKLHRYYICEIPRAGEASRLSTANENSCRMIRSGNERDATESTRDLLINEEFSPLQYNLVRSCLQTWGRSLLGIAQAYKQAPR